MEQVSVAIKFLAFYTASKIGKTGLSVTVNVYGPAGIAIITGALATEIGDGVYSYTLAGASTNTSGEGEYVAVFKTADNTVDQQHLAALWVVGRAGIEDLDAAVSTRLPTSAYTAPGADTPGTATLLDRVSAARAVLLDNLALLDVAISTRAVAGATVVVTGPIAIDGASIHLLQGDTYDADESRKLSWTGVGWPNLIGASAVWKVLKGGRATLYPCVIESASVVSIELSAADTEQLRGAYDYVVVVTLPNGHVLTLAEGILQVGS